MSEPTEGSAVVAHQPHELTINEVKANMARIVSLLKGAMQEGVHYGTIPGTPKPTLYQAGAELILMMFRLEAYPIVEDLSGPDVIRYRVKTQIKHQITGLTVGWGIGECSSDEDKYRWRRAVCDQEWEEADPADRRVKWYRGKNESPYKAKQVRTHPADVANTILKMAEKRSKVGGARSSTAASEVFGQDAEDMSPELRASIYGTEVDTPGEPQLEPRPKPRPAAAEEAPARDTGGTAQESSARQPAGANAQNSEPEYVTSAMVKTLRGRLRAKGIEEAALVAEFKLAEIGALPRASINRAMEWIESK